MYIHVGLGGMTQQLQQMQQQQQQQQQIAGQGMGGGGATALQVGQMNVSRLSSIKIIKI